MQQIFAKPAYTLECPIRILLVDMNGNGAGRTYLDYNATTPLAEGVLDAMLPFLSQSHGNPSSRHEEGRIARQAIDDARSRIAQAVNARPDQVIFTASGTEANNSIVRGIAERDRRPRLAIGAIEHPCVLCAARTAAADGIHNLMPIACDDQGRYDMEDLAESAGKGETALVSLMLANNETGVIQDIAAAVSIAGEAGALIHVDAAQGLGKIPIDFAALGADALTISAHKAGGPKGVAALIVKREVDWAPLLEGGGQESGLRSSTENVAGIVGFGKAAELAAARAQNQQHTAGLRDEMESRLSQAGAVIFGAKAMRLPNTCFFALPRINGETLVMMLDQAGFAVASGSACSSFKEDASHVLLAMEVEEDLAACAVRASLGPDTSPVQVVAFTDAVEQLASRLRSMAATCAT